MVAAGRGQNDASPRCRSQSHSPPHGGSQTEGPEQYVQTTQRNCASLDGRHDIIEHSFPENRRDHCSFPDCGKQVLAKGYCSGHYKQLWKGNPLQPLRPFYGREERYGRNGPCRFNDLPEVKSHEWEPCSASRYRAYQNHGRDAGPSTESPSEEVHHRNKQRDDNRPGNLELWARGSQPPGARVSDLVVEAWRVILLYSGTSRYL
jgi:hypothetical protein